MNLFVAIPLLLCWGSALNSISYRLIHDDSFYKRSFCPSCKQSLKWYELVPVLSWLYLRGQCSTCKKPISILYPFIEVATAITLLSIIWFIPINFWVAHFIFFSALLVTIRSDMQSMLISPVVTLFLIPVGLICSMLGWLPISIIDSVLGAVGGYLFFKLIAVLYQRSTGRDGLGEGDLDLIAFIGAFTGIQGCWFAIVIGSLTGLLYASSSFILNNNTISIREYRIPFGPFLAAGAMLFALFRPLIMSIANMGIL